MKKNEKGFSVTEILIVLAVVGLIGGAGWYVWSNKNQSGNDSLTTASTSDIKKEKPSDTKSGYKLYEDPNLSLQYPDKWVQYKENDRPEWIFFKSPDYKSPPGEGPGATAEAGYWLEIRVAKSETWESYEEDLKNAPTGQQNHGGSYETIKIDGHNAVLSDTKTHGTYWYATSYSNGKIYYFRLNAADEDKPEVKELFKLILETVKIK